MNTGQEKTADGSELEGGTRDTKQWPKNRAIREHWAAWLKKYKLLSATVDCCFACGLAKLDYDNKEVVAKFVERIQWPIEKGKSLFGEEGQIPLATRFSPRLTAALDQPEFRDFIDLAAAAHLKNPKVLPATDPALDWMVFAWINDLLPFQGSLQRSHIVSRVYEHGSNSPGNLWLLCHECHKESEGLETQEAKVRWLLLMDPYVRSYHHFIRKGGLPNIRAIVETATRRMLEDSGNPIVASDIANVIQAFLSWQGYNVPPTMKSYDCDVEKAVQEAPFSVEERGNAAELQKRAEEAMKKVFRHDE